MKGVNADEVLHEKPTCCILNASAVNTKSLGPHMAQQRLTCASSLSLQVLPCAGNIAFSALYAAFCPINYISLASDANEWATLTLRNISSGLTRG